MELSMKMVRRVGGVMGQLGRGIKTWSGKRPIDVEVLSIGPLFQELDRRWLEADTRRAPFSRYPPSVAAWQ
jgi:hypothetical protein